MVSPKLLVRVARRMQKAWSTQARLSDSARWNSLRRLRERLTDLDRALARLERVRERGPVAILPRLQEGIPCLVQAVLNAGTQARQSLEQVPSVPDLKTLIPELQQLEVEFGGVHVDLRGTTIGVTTDPITLEGVHLGAFTIQVNWQHMVHGADGESLRIIARDPNSAATSDDVTHPHVKDETLCAGDAKVPLRKALEEGRLADAFSLVQSVLSHYNPSSAHVHLDDWEGFLCHDCGTTTSDDDRYCCEGCDNPICSECLGSCAKCDSGRCGNCLSRCAVCELFFCSGCLAPCSHSEKDCCSNCLKACAECEALVATDELSAEAGLCPACAGVVQEPIKEVVTVADTDSSPAEGIDEVPMAAASRDSQSLPPEIRDANDEDFAPAACV